MFLLLLILLPVSHSANIFSGAFFGGSHLTAVYDLALILADAGHNVTFVNVVSGELERCAPHPNVHAIDIVAWDGQDKEMMSKKCVARVVKGKSGDPLVSGCIEVWRELWRRSAGVFSGEEVLGMFSRTQFDVILGEGVETNGMALLGTLTNVPVVNFQPSFMIHLSLDHGNLPMLVSSQPSMLYTRQFDQSPSVIERLSGLTNLIGFLPFVQNGPQAMQPFLEKFGFSSLQDVKDSVKLFLTNDHPAFTFPFLRPPNDIPIGCANLLGTRRDPLEFSPQIARFLEESADKDVVYVSFGSYVTMSDVSWYSGLIDILVELDLRVIVKVDKHSDKKFPDSVLPLTWAPQKDLLRSGKVKLFVSHCGNNGRLETIFYNVPVLCVPQFGDQPICAELIKLNGFGESLMKEDILIRARELVATMIANHGTYQEKMKKASDIVETEPGSVRENLVFYVEHVAKFKNADYLVNKVIKQQNVVEMYNLDIILPACVVLISVVGLILYVLFRFCIYFGRKLSVFGLKRHKSE